MNPIKIENFDTMNVHAHLFTLQNEHLTIKISDYGATIVAILMKKGASMNPIKIENFDTMNVHAHLFTLQNEHLTIKISDYGATIVAILMKDRYGKTSDIVLGFDNLQGYLQDKGKIYYGATIGRNANRIKNGKFTLNGKTYQLAINNGPNHLHGGIDNFSSKIFDYEIKENTLKLSYLSKDMEEGYPGELKLDVFYTLKENQLEIFSSKIFDYEIKENTLKLSYLSKDMEEGYPGELKLDVFYTLKENQLEIVYDAISDQDTVCNITNHTYFNLAGEGSGSIAEHFLQIKADHFIGCDTNGMATTEFDVDSTPFDFRNFHKIDDYLHQNHLQLLNAKGFDHHFIFNADQNQIQLKDEKSGRRLTFSSTQNGAQIYTANWFEEEHGKGNSIYRQHDGIAIEPQWMPDAINRKEQPSLLKANQPYHQVTTITFDIDQ